MEHTARHIAEWLTALADIGAAVNNGMPLPQLLSTVSRTVCELLGFDFCAVTLPDPEHRTLRFEGWHGLSPEYIEGVNSTHAILIEEGPDAAPSSQSFLTGKPVQIIDTINHPSFSSWRGVARDQGFASMIAVPLVVESETVGTLNCYTARQHGFDDELPLLSMIADQAAISITSARLRVQQSQTIQKLNLVNEHLERQRELQSQADRIHKRLTAISLQGGGVPDLVEAMSELLSRPVAVRTTGGQLLYSTASGDETLPRALTAEEDLKLLDHLQAQPATIREQRMPSPDGGMINIICTPVVLQDETVAYTWLPGHLSELQPLDFRTLEHASTVLALELLRARSAAEAEWRRSDEVLSAVLGGELADTAALMERSRSLGHSIDLEPHMVLVLRRFPGRREIPRHRLAAAFRNIGRGHAHKPVLGAHHGYLTVLWPIPDGHSQDWESVVDDVRNACGIGRTSEPVLTSVTGPVHELSDYRRTYEIGRGAVELAAGRGASEEIFWLHDLGLAGVFLQFHDLSALDRVMRSILEPLYSYDARNGTDLLRTLTRLLENNLNAQQTAESLFVHKNTVTQRRHRIEQLLKRSLNDIGSLAEVAMAVQIAEVLRLRPSRH